MRRPHQQGSSANNNSSSNNRGWASQSRQPHRQRPRQSADSVPGSNIILHDPCLYDASSFIESRRQQQQQQQQEQPQQQQQQRQIFQRQTYPSSVSTSSAVRSGPICIALSILILIPLVVFNTTSTTLVDQDGLKAKVRGASGDNPHFSHDNTGTYTSQTWKTERTVGVRTVAETAFARCDVHTVVSEDGRTVVRDWIFMEEKSAINVLVMTDTNKFVVLQQHKYAIPGVTLSPVGGMIEDDTTSSSSSSLLHHETPFDAAKREVREELGLGSRQTLLELQTQMSTTTTMMGQTNNDDKKKETSTDQIVSEKDSNNNPPITNKLNIVDEYGLPDGTVPLHEQESWVYLGMYRTAANRGGGFVYSYLLKDAVPLNANGNDGEHHGTNEGFTTTATNGDDEAMKILYLTREELMEALVGGQFKEVKWTATIALALLHLNKNIHSEREGEGTK